MHPHEVAVVRSFILAPRRPRWLESLGDPKRRSGFLDRLNHCRDLDEHFARPIPYMDVAALLRSHAAPAGCHVISAVADIDGREMPLAEAVDLAEAGGWGTILSCIPGHLACYIDERGSNRRMILAREADASRSASTAIQRAGGTRPGGG